MLTNRLINPNLSLLRSRLKEDTIPKPVGLGWVSPAIKRSSRLHQVFFKTSSRISSGVRAM
jgi:hypothetical protein